MNENRLNEVISAILGRLPQDGSNIGNKSMTSILSSEGVGLAEYKQAKAVLLDRGVISSARGRGGGIRLSSPTPSSSQHETSAQHTRQGGASLAKEEEKSVRRAILEHVPKDGSSIGNKNLIAKLQKDSISQETYWIVRNRMIDEGILLRGRGLGGSVRMNPEGAIRPKVQVTKAKYRREPELYQSFFESMKRYWMRDVGLQEADCVVDLTAHQGQKRTGGKWTRPDVTLVSVRSFHFIPGRLIDVITFEIKPANCVDVAGVFETASHSRFAHKSYLAVYMPDGLPDDEYTQRILSECDRFGIGFMYFKSPDDWDTYEILIEPKRQNPDPDEIERFISTQLSKESQDRIAKMK